MEKENKYYTPSIKEFYVGFECEVNWNKGYENKFTPLTIDIKDKNGVYTNTLQEVIIAYDDKYAEFRVKYLDQKDIESLGWIKQSEDIPKISCYKESYKKDNYFLIHVKDNFYKIVVFDIAEESDKLGLHEMYIPERFLGKLKNKSELKRLMEMLEI